LVIQVEMKTILCSEDQITAYAYRLLAFSAFTVTRFTICLALLCHLIPLPAQARNIALAMN